MTLPSTSRRAARLARSSSRRRDAAFVARAARLDALADPDLLLRQQLVDLGVDHRFLRELLFLLRQVLLEVARVGAQLAAVELDDAGGDAIEEAAVVGDDDDAALEVDQQLLEPLDGVEVEVVGRLVEQQHVGGRHQRLRQGDALAGAAGERADAGVAVEVQAMQRFFDALLPVPGVEGFDLRLQRVEVQPVAARQIQVADRRSPRPGPALAAVKTSASMSSSGSCAT